jgi:beta-aspartyl-peptidase (threonine type)
MLKPSLLVLCFSALVASSPVMGLHQDLSQPAQGQKPAKPANADDQQQEMPEEIRANLEEGVKHMLVSQIEAWNHGKLEAFMQGYWHSPELVFFSGGTVTKGWEPTLERYRLRYQSQGREMGKLDFQDLKIDLISRKAAVFTGVWQLEMSDGKKPHGLFTLIVKRMPGGWRIVHDHTSVAE